MQMKDVIDATGARQVRQSRDTGGRIFFLISFSLSWSDESEWMRVTWRLTESAIAAQQVALVGVDDAVGSAHRLVLLGTETRTRAGHFPFGSYTCCQWKWIKSFLEIFQLTRADLQRPKRPISSAAKLKFQTSAAFNEHIAHLSPVQMGSLNEI